MTAVSRAHGGVAVVMLRIPNDDDRPHHNPSRGASGHPAVRPRRYAMWFIVLSRATENCSFLAAVGTHTVLGGGASR